MKIYVYQVIRVISLTIFLAFIVFAFTVEGSNFKNLKSVVDPRDLDSRTLVSIDPLRPWVLDTKRNVDYQKSTGKLPTYENLELEK